MSRRWILLGAVVLAAAGAGTGIAVAVGDDDTPLTGAALRKASAAALAHTGGGKVTDTETDDEEGYYEVEVTLPDGRQVDVHLDRAFTVLSTQADHEDPDDDGDED